MTRDKPLIIMNIAGLSLSLLSSGGCPNLEAFAGVRRVMPMRPVLPALTLSMQATFMTGEQPGKHGIVGNGFYDREWNEHLSHTFLVGYEVMDFFCVFGIFHVDVGHLMVADSKGPASGKVRILPVLDPPHPEKRIVFQDPV